MTELRDIAKSLFKAAIAAADPELAVRKELLANPIGFCPGGRTMLIAFGKAAGPMMREALKHLAVHTKFDAVAVTNYENACQIDGCEVILAGHPVPDENGVNASQRIVDLLKTASAKDQVIFLISGGGSAILPAPKGITLAEKIALNDLLLSHSIDIKGINLVRQQVSKLKGGGMARLASPAKMRSLIVSDVIDNDIRAIASGPTAQPLGTANDAVTLLKSSGLWEKLPDATRAQISKEKAAASSIPTIENTIICSNQQSTAAALQASQGWRATLVSNSLTGDVADAAQEIVDYVKAAPLIKNQIFVWGGETTVKIKGDGKGGRNQELALRVALLAKDFSGDWTFLSGGTDGRDGPTDAAGGVVDAGTVDRILARGQNPLVLLNNNDSYAALDAAGDLLMTGATGTNVADIQIFVRAPAGARNVSS